MAFDEPSKHRKKAKIYRWHSYAGKREGAVTSATPPKEERKRRRQSKSGGHGIGDHSKRREKNAQFRFGTGIRRISREAAKTEHKGSSRRDA